MFFLSINLILPIPFLPFSFDGFEIHIDTIAPYSSRVMFFPFSSVTF